MPEPALAAASVPMDAELTTLAEAGRARGLAPLPAITVAEARERIVKGNALCASGPQVASVVDLTVPVGGGVIGVRVYSPEARPAATLVYFHGGGWITGELGYPDELCRFLAADAGLRVVSVDYRLAPEHPFPGPLEDAWAAIQWTARTYDDTPLGIAGDSAGGNLAAVCTHRARDHGLDLRFQVLVYAVTDSDLERESYVSCATAFPLGRADLAYCFDRYAPDPGQRASAEVSPVRAADLSGLPPALVVVAGHDPLHDEGVAYAARLVDAGVPTELVEHPTLCHGFLRFSGASAAVRSARDDLVASVRRLADESRGRHADTSR